MSAGHDPDVERVFRSTSGLIALFGFGALGIFLLGEAAVRTGIAAAVLLAPWVLLGVWVVYVISAASMVRMDAQGVVVQNYLRRTAFGWKQVRDIDVRWQLEFTLSDTERRLACSGGPVHGRPRRAKAQMGVDPEPQVPSGYRELAEIRDRWQNAGADADAPIRRSWDLPALIALAGLFGWAAAAVLTVQS